MLLWPVLWVTAYNIKLARISNKGAAVKCLRHQRFMRCLYGSLWSYDEISMNRKPKPQTLNPKELRGCASEVWAFKAKA